ncbi:MAG: hypothetical protein EAX89_01595 [Candidatus Lokiarchaeota archaeon]|nr:hypothetical protein [Candidatus Lokiarchaeota archaeon]
MQKNKKVTQFAIMGFIFCLFLVISEGSKFNECIVDLNNNNYTQNFDPAYEPGFYHSSDISGDIGGYNKINTTHFKTLENATSTITENDHLAVPNNYFNITTPNLWNASSMQFEIEPYSKQQIVQDSPFEYEYDFWGTEKRQSGDGYFIQYDLKDYNYGRTRIYNSKDRSTPAFYPGDFAFWTQNLLDINPQSLPIQRGRIIQKEDQTILNFNSFNTNPGFYKDSESPYGGIYKPLYDFIDLYYEESLSSLKLIIDPSSYSFGGNPSAAWWYYILVPYEADYAQMTITWSLDEQSTFETEDKYEIIARINNKYINGNNWISKEGEIPYNGSDTALMVYNNPEIIGHVNHGTISRTYNITNLINGLVGINKFDFGAWARAPSHGGDEDLISVNFESIEILYNTTTKYEVARLDYSYKLIDVDGTGVNPFKFDNDASIVLYLGDLETSNYQNVRVLPFSMAEVSYDDYSGTPWHHMSFSLSQEYEELLKVNNLAFKIGVAFENNYYNEIDYISYLDDVYFTINYKQTISNSRLYINTDNAPIWDNVTEGVHYINISDWIGGSEHSFQFLTYNLSLEDKLYLNFKSSLAITFETPLGAFASYSIPGSNADRGIWNIKYDNSFSYNQLLYANYTPYFNLSGYAISYLDMPAFDLNASNSINWEIFEALTPTLTDFTENLFLFNHTPSLNLQSATIFSAFRLGNWTLRGYQPNYIISGKFNNTVLYSSLPAFYSYNSILYNLSLLESTMGNYTIELYNGIGNLLNEFPQHFPSNNDKIEGNLNLDEKYAIGKYYLRFLWNDTSNYLETGKALRFGSYIMEFFILNKTHAEFSSLISQVSSGETAYFGINYSTYLGWGISGATIQVYENSTGTLRLWGRVWTGSYQVGYISYLGQGNYSIPLYTEGAPNGTYPIYFVFSKYLHETQVLTTSLKIIAENFFEFNIVSGASEIDSKWVLSSNNIPYVNDTINSMIRVNLTDGGIPVTGGLVLGTIGMTENYFKAVEIGNGLYDLTLNTTGLNATKKVDSQFVENETLKIRCSASGYDIKHVNITIFIDKIPTQISLQNIQPIYAEGNILATATIVNKIDPLNPKPNNNANLTYYIYQGTTFKLNGSLGFLMSGVYQKQIYLSGLLPGGYAIYINGSSINCADSQSNIINFTILPQDATLLDISIPTTLRILKEFQIRTTLTYAINSTPIQGQIIYLNISVGLTENFIITTITNIEGISTYQYIIPQQYKGQNITIHAYYQGQSSIAASSAKITKIIQGKIPIMLNIIQYPNVLRVGYSARYALQINITEGSESLQNRIIFFSAYYDDQLDIPFVTNQLYTDENGLCYNEIPEIANGKMNLTIYFEYLGSTTVAYNITSKFDLIQPKWTSNFSMQPLPSVMRFGQTIRFEIHLYCENSSIILQNLPIFFTFRYGTTIEIYTGLIGENNTLVYLYGIPNSFTGDLNLTIVFDGTNKIEGYSLNFSFPISPKIQVQLEFREPPQTQYMYGTYSFEVWVTDELGNPLDGLFILFQILDNDDNLIYNFTAICENGIAIGSLDLSVGNNYKIKVDYIGEEYYESAQLTSANFRVINEFIIFLDLVPYIIIAVGILVAFIFIIHRGVVVPKRRRKVEALKNLYQKLSDVENIPYIIILTSDGGVPCFSKSLADVPIDETLISGFLSAISSFGQEIGSKITEGVGGLEELSYRQFKIILNEGKYTRVALLLLRRPSNSLKEKLKFFNHFFEEVYKERLISFSGEVFDDASVTKMIEDIFEADLLYPHQIVETKVQDYLKSSMPNNVDKKIIVIARSEDFESNFYLRELINHLKTKGIEEIKSFESIQKLKSDKVVFAINPRTNYLIAEFQKYIKHMDSDDKNILFAIFDGSTDIMKINKYLNKRNLKLSKDIDKTIEKLKSLHLINELNQTTEIGSAVATLLKLIPDL